ncbi:chromate transporter [Neorhizobium sp. NCHU2750]|uniref:chromate transporter n=1 Tax=Neorhizobium sp. NCHU2750 TaxID=1825976 RepID=UPI000E75D39A|nr:chromate transporter [Neorhizobium sp. NCHU2750]
MRDNVLLHLALIFIPLSLTSIGGGAAIIAGAQHQTVEIQHWISEAEFVHLFAISRAAPGPGTMLATAIGFKVSGWTGAAVATLALFLPSSLLCYTVFRLTNAHREKRWHKTMREGLAPVGTGLIMAGAMSLFRVSGGGPLALATACASCLLLYLAPRFPVVAMLALGGAVAVAAASFFG